MNTLLVIDMQNAWLDNPASPKWDAAAVIARINHAAQCIRRCGGRVIFVQHEAEDAVAGSTAWDIISTLEVDKVDLKVGKQACDPFAHTSLAEVLSAAPPDTLYLCGFATEFCVDSAVRAATSRALKVVVLSDAHTTSDRPHLPAGSIIAHHNWVWSNLAFPDDSTLSIMPTAKAFPEKC